MKNKIFAVIGIILIVIFTLLFILCGTSDNSVIAYVFSIIGTVLLIITSIYAFKNKDDISFKASVPMTVLTYIIVSVVFSAVVLVLGLTAMLAMPSVLFAIIHAVILAVFVIRILLLYLGTKHISASEKKVADKTGFIKNYKVTIDMLAGRAENGSIKDSLSKLSEQVRFSDPVSVEDVSDIEKELAIKADELKANLNNREKADVLIKDISNLVAERNAKIKILK